MSNVDERPGIEVCESGSTADGIQVIEHRDVPLGGPRAMNVRRTLPSRERSLIGAWCFCDHYGPDDVALTDGMQVPAHPHTGLATVSWLFSGEIEHRDSAGFRAMVVPGDVNLMTAGRGISHSEITTDAAVATGGSVLHGVQLWYALPDAVRHTDPGLQSHTPRQLTGGGHRVRVFLGSLLGETSPVQTLVPLLGAEILLDAGAGLTLDVEPGFEHGVLVDAGAVRLADQGAEQPSLETRVERDQLAYVPTGRASLTLRAGDEPARLILLGGPPFGEQIIMWWNFVGRTHDEVVRFREEWQEQITGDDGEVVAESRLVGPGRFGVVDDSPRPIPAPALPKNVRLKLRG